MKWLRCEYEGRARYGILKGESVQLTDLNFQAVLMGQQKHFLAEVPLQDVRPLSPCAKPGKVICVGRNYAEHAREQRIQPPDRPMIFSKFTSAIIGHRQVICWSTSLTQKVDFEGELAVVIGKTALRVDSKDALNYVFGYTIANDVTARDLQRSDGQWQRGKSLDTFCPLGPIIVTTDEIPDPQNLRIRSFLNGELMQDGHTRDMIFNVAYLVSYCSHAFTLEPGDLLLTGTPEGVGMFREPPVFMQDGDEIAIEIEGIGRLENTCSTF